MRKIVKKSLGPRPRLTVDISPALKRRIKVAAAAQEVPVSAFITKLLEQAVPAAETTTKSSGSVVTSQMTKRAKRLRAEQTAPFIDDSADLIREARKQRHAEL
jgi:hypothetical protein